MCRTTLTIILALGVGSSACATKKFVRGQVEEVNTKVETLTGTVEETQQRTQQNEKRIVEVDAKADQVGLWAKDAQGTADSASSAAGVASSAAGAASAKADTIDRLNKRLLYEVVISEAQGSFAFGKAELPGPAKARIDELIGQLKADPRGNYVEIEGHTDNVGPDELNVRLGLERAEAVKRYLYDAHQVPLHKINVISYGEEKPAAPNTNREGRAQNRRVVIRVLA